MKPSAEPLARRNKELCFNLLPEEKDLLRRAACHLGFNFLTEFVRSAALERARQALATGQAAPRRA